MLKVGWANENITPKRPVWLCGYAARTKFSEGVHDPVFVKACYLSDGKTEAVLLSCDLAAVSYTQVEKIRKKIKKGCGLQNVIIGATHTHSGPASCEQLVWEENLLDWEWIAEMEEKAAAAAINAKKNAEPMKLYSGTAPVPEVAKNRRAGETEADKELGLLFAKNKNGQVKGIIVNYACHCTILDSSNYLISADYPFYIYKETEKLFPGVTTLFFNGACGDLNIGYSADASALGANMGNLRSYENAEKMAGFIVRGLKHAMNNSVELENRITQLNIPLDFPCRDNLPAIPSLILEKEQLEKNKTEDVISQTKLVYVKALFHNIKNYCKNGEKTVNSETCILTIGNAVIVTVPGELFCEIGKVIKAIFRPIKDGASALGRQVFVFGFTNGYVGYLPTKKAVITGGYECETGVHGAETEAYFIDVIKKAAERLL